jgi:hypothetical protein
MIGLKKTLMCASNPLCSRAGGPRTKLMRRCGCDSRTCNTSTVTVMPAISRDLVGPAETGRPRRAQKPRAERLRDLASVRREASQMVPLIHGFHATQGSVSETCLVRFPRHLRPRERMAAVSIDTHRRFNRRFLRMAVA